MTGFPNAASARSISAAVRRLVQESIVEMSNSMKEAVQEKAVKHEIPFAQGSGRTGDALYQTREQEQRGMRGSSSLAGGGGSGQAKNKKKSGGLSGGGSGGNPMGDYPVDSSPAYAMDGGWTARAIQRQADAQRDSGQDVPLLANASAARPCRTNAWWTLAPVLSPRKTARPHWYVFAVCVFQELF